MPRMDVTEMPFAKLYPLLVTKAEKKGRTREDVDQVTAWLTGYTPEELSRLEQSGISYGDFFRNAPDMNPNRELITGTICGVRVEDDPLMREIRIWTNWWTNWPRENPWNRFCGSKGRYKPGKVQGYGKYGLLSKMINEKSSCPVLL